MLACAAGLGNSHPPGYPLLVLVGRLALVVPVGHPAFRFNAAVAACAGMAAVLWGRLVATAVHAWLGGGPRLAAAAGAFAAAAWAFSDAFWWEAVIGDKYAPFYLAFAALLWAGAHAGRAVPPALGREAVRTGLVAGLAFAHHQYALFALPALAVAAGRAGVLRAFGARVALGRALALGTAVALLPLSTKLLVPPLRSGGGADPDWAAPRRAARLAAYLTGALYRTPFAATSLPVNPWLSGGRLGLAGRFLREEAPWILWIAAPIGMVVAARRAPWAAVAAAGCLAANAVYCLNFSEKVVRWWEPSLALVLAAAAVGYARLALFLRGWGTVWMALLALGAAGLQVRRGWDRNDLSRWYAAHDFGRQVLRALPPGACYLGAGDFDLFPVWALRVAGQERPDVEAAGVAGFIDARLAAGGAEGRILARAGVRATGPGGVAALLAGAGHLPVFIPPAGFDRRLQEALPFLMVTEIHGLVARPVAAWNPGAGVTATRRQRRAMTRRGLRYARAGALADLARPRDEVARGALLQYAACLSTLGQQCARFGLEADAAWAFHGAREDIEALAGAGSRPGPGTAQAGTAQRAEEDRRAIALAYQRLADVFGARGVTFLADQFRSNAAAVMR